MKINKTQIVEINQTNFNAEVLESTQPVMAAFLAPWSRPCRIISPVLNEVALASAGTLKIVRINADNFPDLGIWYDIRSIPTLLCFVRGEVRARVVGTASKEAILSKVEPFLSQTNITSKSQNNNIKP
jgi:thioredoxin 1